MLADDAAKALFPPQDGSTPGVDRNERVRHAFVLGTQWQKDAWKDGAPLPAEVIEKVNRFAANLCEGGQYRDVKMTVEEIWDLAAEYTRALIVVEQKVAENIPAEPDGGRYPYGEPIGTPITPKALEDALGRAINETDPVAEELHQLTKTFQDQNRVLREILAVIKAKR